VYPGRHVGAASQGSAVAAVADVVDDDGVRVGGHDPSCTVRRRRAMMIAAAAEGVAGGEEILLQQPAVVIVLRRGRDRGGVVR